MKTNDYKSEWVVKIGYLVTGWPQVLKEYLKEHRDEFHKHFKEWEREKLKQGVERLSKLDHIPKESLERAAEFYRTRIMQDNK